MGYKLFEKTSPKSCSKKTEIYYRTVIFSYYYWSGAVGRFIRRRPSQQQIRPKTGETEASKSKLPRSRSERVLSTKKGGHQECEDGFSVQEIAASFGKLIYHSQAFCVIVQLKVCSCLSLVPFVLAGVGSSTGSPTEAKFRAELKKLHQQYPDHILSLLTFSRYFTLCILVVQEKRSINKCFSAVFPLFQMERLF